MRRSKIRELLFDLIRSYYRETGKDDFTYNEIRKYYYGTYIHRAPYKADWHSIERALRLLAAEGLLIRHYPHPKKVIFIMSPLLRGDWHE